MLHRIEVMGIPASTCCAALLLLLTASCGPSSSADDPVAGKASASKYPADDTEAVRMQVKSKAELARTELEQLLQKMQSDIVRRFEHPTCDGLIADMKALKAETDLAVQRMTLQLDDLAGFLKQNDGYATQLDFASTRSFIDDARAKATGFAAGIAQAASGVQDVRIKVNAGSGDWESTQLEVKSGDLVAFEAEGSWTVGGWAGPCGPGGMAGYTNYSLLADRPHGCLLVRVGDFLVSAGKKSDLIGVSGKGGTVNMRCNDKKATDNSGALSLRLVLAPLSVASSAKNH